MVMYRLYAILFAQFFRTMVKPMSSLLTAKANKVSAGHLTRETLRETQRNPDKQISKLSTTERK